MFNQSSDYNLSVDLSQVFIGVRNQILTHVSESIAVAGWLVGVDLNVKKSVTKNVFNTFKSIYRMSIEFKPLIHIRR